MKKVISLMLAVIIMLSVVPMTELGVTAGAVSFSELNADNVFFKQNESRTCTLCAAAMMMRRYSMLRGDSGWSSITESSIKSTAWLAGAGLYNSFSYSNNSVGTIKVANYSLPRNSSNASVIIEELKKCPEGIVLYNGNAPHAILLTDYTNGVFYCADPAGGVASGRIPISQAYKVTINNATSYWKVTSPIVDGPTEHVHDYSGDRVYQGEHPHAISQRCVDYESCGGFIWTGENNKLNDCSACWDLRLEFSKSSITVEKGNSVEVSLTQHGSCYPSSTVIEKNYDKNIMKATFSNLTYTIEGLNVGRCTFKINVYSDSSKNNKFCSDTIDVIVVDNNYTLAYNANGGDGAPSDQTGASSYTVSSIIPKKEGYTFLGWSKSSTATSASYKSGDTIKLTGRTILYAVWKKNPTYTLSYNANGGSGAPSSQTGAASYTISSTEPTRTGYTFRGWSKSSSASTVSYRPDDTIDISTNTTLYAVWKKSFYGDVDNDGVITSSDLMLLNKLLRGISVDSLNTLKGDLDGDEELSDNDLSLLAKFYQMKTDTFPVENKFYAFTICDTPDKTEYKSGEKINTDGLSVAIVYRDANYHIVNEGLTISPEYASGSGKQTITVTLGDWSTDFTITVEDTTAYTFSYNANGGSGAPSSQTGAKSYTVSSTVPTRKGYTFLGWAKSSSATTASYKPSDSITISSNTTLYAVWKAASSISSGKEYTTTIDFASQEYYYTFTPSSSGNYTFESIGSLDTKVYVYSSLWSELGVNDDAGTDSNFKLNLNLTSGNKYYVKVRAYGSKVGTTKFNVVKDHTHSYTSSVTTLATCKNEGVKTYKCSCGASYTESIAKKDHTIVTDKSVDATCTKTGLTEGKHCSVCNTVTVAQKTVAKKEHKDSNGDGKCDSCKKQLSADKPEASKCNCNCHGSGISKLFFKISLIFKRIFGLDRTCTCGVNHY